MGVESRGLGNIHGKLPNLTVMKHHMTSVAHTWGPMGAAEQNLEVVCHHVSKKGAYQSGVPNSIYLLKVGQLWTGHFRVRHESLT